MIRKILILFYSCPAMVFAGGGYIQTPINGTEINPSTVTASTCLRTDGTGSHFFVGGGCGVTEAVFNENSADVDLRVESNGNTSMLHVDAGNDRVGIGTANPATVLDVNGASQFGSGATKSTFSATGNLVLANNATLTVSGASGDVVFGSSVTGSSFYGDGANLTALNASNLASGTVPNARLDSSSVTLLGSYSVTVPGDFAAQKTATIGTNTGADASLILNSANGPYITGQEAGVIKWYAGESDQIFTSGTNNSFGIRAAAGVDIGTGTTGIFRLTNTGLLEFGSNGSPSNDILYLNSLAGPYITGQEAGLSKWYLGSSEQILTNGTEDALGLRSATGIEIGSGGADIKMRLDTTGKMSVGTDISPASTLHVHGSAQFGSTAVSSFTAAGALNMASGTIVTTAGTAGTGGYVFPIYTLAQLQAASPGVVGLTVMGPSPTYDFYVATGTSVDQWINQRTQVGP